MRSLAVDRVRALVKPAMEQAQRASPSATEHPTAFELLEQEAEELAQEPTGVGLDVPPWLAALEQEVDEQRRSRARLTPTATQRISLPQAPLGIDEVQQQLTGWEQHPN